MPETNIKWIPSSTRNAWIFMISLILFVLFIWVIWWLIRQYVRNIVRREQYWACKQSHKKNKCCKKDIYGGGNLSVAGTGAFANGVLTNEITGFGDCSVATVNPLLVQGGLRFPRFTVDDIQHNIQQGGIYLYVNTSGSEQQTYLPLASQEPGSVVILVNKSNNANVHVLAQPGDSLNMTVTDVLVPVWALLVSDGQDNWVIQIIS